MKLLRTVKNNFVKLLISDELESNELFNLCIVFDCSVNILMPSLTLKLGIR